MKVRQLSWGEGSLILRYLLCKAGRTADGLLTNTAPQSELKKKLLPNCEASMETGLFYKWIHAIWSSLEKELTVSTLSYATSATWCSVWGQKTQNKHWFPLAELPAKLTVHGCDLSDGFTKLGGPLTCHAGGEKITAGHRLDGDSRLTLKETWNELRLHLLHHTGQAGLSRAHWWSLRQ